MGLGSVFKYSDDLIQGLTEFGKTVSHAEEAAKLAENARTFFAGKTSVTNADINEWLRSAQRTGEFDNILRTPALRDRVRALAVDSRHRSEFVTQFDSMLNGRAGNLSDTEIESLARTHNLSPDSPFVMIAREARDQRRAAAQAGRTNPTATGSNTTPPDPVPPVNAADNTAGAGARTGDNADEVGDGARTVDDADAADEVGDGARVDADDVGGGGANAGRNAGPNGRNGRVEGRIMPVNFAHWTHRLAGWHPSSLFERVPVLGKMFSLGSLRNSLPNIGVVNHFIRPAVQHADTSIRSSGVMEKVINLQGEFRLLTDDLANGRITQQAMAGRIDEIFGAFADNPENIRMIDDALVEINRLLREVKDGQSVLPTKYPGLTGLTDRQAASMETWLTDLRDTMNAMRRAPDGTLEIADRYKRVVEGLIQKGADRTSIAETFNHMITSRLNRLGEDVRMRLDQTTIRRGVTQPDGSVTDITDPALLHQRAALERQLESSSYNRFDRTTATVSPRAQNVELHVFEMLNQYKKREAGGNWDVEAANTFFGWMDAFYKAGVEHDVNRVIRILKAKMGGSAMQTVPQGLMDRIDKAMAAADPHRRAWLESVKDALVDNKDRGTKFGPREVERRYYAPFAEFMMIATGYPVPRGSANFWTEMAVPTIDNYLRTPISNGAKEAWTYVTGGRTVGPTGFREGETTIDASHKIREMRYDWWFRRAPRDDAGNAVATNTGLLGRGTDRSLFGVLGRDGYLDRMPWYLKMPMRLASGGMISTESRVGLTLPGKILIGGAAAAYGLEQGSALAGWGNGDGNPGWQTSVDPRGAINLLQRGGLGFYDFWWDDLLGGGTRLTTGHDLGIDIDSIGVPFSDMNIRQWVLSWTETGEATPQERQRLREISDEMKARAQAMFDEMPTHAGEVGNLYQSTEQLMQKLREEAAAARQRGETDKANKLDQLTQQLGNDQTRMQALITGVAAKRDATQEAMDAFRNSTDVLAAEEALTHLENHRNDLREMSTQARQTYDAMRARIQAVPEAAAVLGAVTVPPSVVVTSPDPSATTPDPNAGRTTPDPNAGRTTPDPNAGRTTPDPNAGGTQGGPVFIGPTTSDNTRTGTPEQQLAAVKAEAARAARNAADSARSSQDAVTYLNDTVRQIRELQEYARDNGGTPAAFDAPLAEAQRLAQEANIAAQAADQANRRSAEILAQVNTASVSTLEDARAKMQEIQAQAQTARQAQQRAAQANTRMRETLERNTELDEQLHRRRQEDRVRSVTGFVDGGNNGILSNLTRDRGQPGGTSFLGQAFNSISDAFGGVRDWWTRDVARYASRSEGGKMMYQGANIALGGLAALMGIGLWNSTIGKWTGTQVSGGMKLLVVGAVLLYMFRGSSDVGDRLDRMAGRYRATGDDYAGGDGTSGPSPFRAGSVSVQTLSGGTRDVTVPGSGDATRTLSHDDGRVFTETVDRARREANLQGTGGSLPSETGEVYHRAIRVTNSDGRVLGSDVVDFRLGGPQQELVPAQ